MTAATQLQIYNDALILCEERMLASVTEARKPRYLLDQVWNNGGVQACLEEGLWTFAMRTVCMQPNPAIQPQYGYRNAYQKPSDYVRTAGISSDAYFTSALTQFADEDGYWWCDLAALYVKYVSKDQNYGLNLTMWPESFKQFVVAHFADKIVCSLTHDKQIQAKVQNTRKTTLYSSRGKDSMNEPPGFFPRGQLSRARQGMYYGRGWNGRGWYQ